MSSGSGLLVLLLVGGGTVLILLWKLAGVLVMRVSERLVTGRFRAAESLLEHGRIPEAWLARIQSSELRGIAARVFFRNGAGRDERAHRTVMRMLNDLARYFAGSPFFDTPETKTHFLQRLKDLRAAWQDLPWQELLSRYGPGSAPLPTDGTRTSPHDPPVSTP